MKTLIPLLLALFTLPVLADDEIDGAAMDAFSSFESAWEGGDAKGMGSLFDSAKGAKVSLSLDESGSYSRDQAIALLKKYFESTSDRSIEVAKDGRQGGDNPSTTYTYKYKDSDDKKRTAKVYVQLVKKNDQWVISKITVLK